MYKENRLCESYSVNDETYTFYLYKKNVILNILQILVIFLEQTVVSTILSRPASSSKLTWGLKEINADSEQSLIIGVNY